MTRFKLGFPPRAIISSGRIFWMQLSLPPTPLPQRIPIASGVVTVAGNRSPILAAATYRVRMTSVQRPFDVLIATG